MTDQTSGVLAIAGQVVLVCTQLVNALSQDQSETPSDDAESPRDNAATERAKVWNGQLRDAHAQLERITPETGIERLHFGCKVLAADVCLRLDLTAGEKTSHRAWSSDHLNVLRDRLSWLRGEIQKSGSSQTGDVSRVLWTGPGQEDPQRSSTAVKQEHLEFTPRSRQISPQLKEAVEQTLQNADKTELLQETFLESLAFPSMLDREEAVATAHGKTFDWILSDPSPEVGRPTAQHDFVPWLQRSDRGQMYWVNGKAGSGKSTLLRFIAQHERTEACLRQWAGTVPLVVVNFFFWTGGSVLQRSHAGLLRSLLWQVLLKRPDLIAWAFPEVWIACQDTKRRVGILKEWEFGTLVKGFHSVLDQAAKSSRICLFIDGLDEFEGREDAVIELVRGVVDISPNIKACVSSRPWPAFEKAFRNVPQILLQELTGADIEQYVTDQLHQNAATRQIVSQVSDAELQHLKAVVLGQANGVFLWASLALQRVTQQDRAVETIEALGQALRELPSDLNDLFRHLLFDGQKAEALEQQSHILRILRARDEVCDFTGDDSVRSISLYQMALACFGDIASTEMPIRQCDQDTVLKQCTSFAQLLADRCAGLIVLTSPDRTSPQHRSRLQEESNPVEASANRRVHYLHRTVRDFLAYSGVWATITSHSNNPPLPFDPHITLLCSHILRLRSPLQKPSPHRRLDEYWHDDIVPAMTHARFASPTTPISHQATLLDRLDETLTWYWRKRGFDPLDTWARHAFGSYEERNKHKTPFHHAFLSLAAKFGLAEYLRVKFASGGEFGYEAGLPLLTHALEMLVSRRQSVYPLSSLAVVEVLLEAGESPNQVYKTLAARDETPWVCAVRYLREGKRRGWIRGFDVESDGTARWTRILGSMFAYGADPGAVIEGDRWDAEVTVRGVVEDVAEAYFAADVWGLRRKMEE